MNASTRACGLVLLLRKDISITEKSCFIGTHGVSLEFLKVP